MTTVKTVHDTDIGTGLEIAGGKVNVAASQATDAEVAAAITAQDTAENAAEATAKVRRDFIQRTREVMTNTAKWVLSGTGVKWGTTGASPWSFRLITMGAGEGTYGAADGHYNINSPAVGAVVKSLNGGADLVVDASGFIPLPVQSSLFFKMPAPNTGHAAGTGLEFFYSTWNAVDYVIPEDYIYLGSVNNEDFNGAVFTRWDKQIIIQGDNWPDTNWSDLAPHFGAGISNYGGGYRTARFRRRGNRVFVEGLVNAATTAGLLIGTLPAGFRPKTRHIFHSAQDNAFAPRVDVTAAGEIIKVTTSTNAWTALDGISFDLA